MSPPRRGAEAAAEKVIAGIHDPELESRYPNGVHFVPADHPRHGEMATRALFAGSPVVLVYPDGREMLFTPEQAQGALALALVALAAITWLSSRARRRRADVIQFPPRTRIEARDSAGIPTAA